MPTAFGPCDVCGAMCRSKCQRCKRVRYCSKRCQVEGWLGGHREACGSAATAASGGAAEATADPPPTLARPPVEPLAENSFDCPICLEILCEPVTLPCGHSFCAACVTDTLAAAAARCPSCRAEVPGRVAGDLRVNRLLEQVVHAKAPAAYDARRAALDAPSPTVSEAGTWVVVVDPLSPASLVVLGLLAVLKAPVTIEREGMLWSDDKRRPEWVKDSLREGVPRLELRGAARNGNCVVGDPAAIVRALLELYGEGRVDVGPTRDRARAASLAERVRGEHLLATVWSSFVNKISQHVFSAVWDGHANVPSIEGVVEAIEWAEREAIPELRTHDGPRRTVLEIAVAAPLVLLWQTNDVVLEDALAARPRLRRWFSSVTSSDVGAAVCRHVRGAPQFDEYRQRIRRGVMMAIMMVSGQDTIGLHSRRGEDALVHPRFPYHDCTEGRRVEREWRTQEDRYKELTFEDYILSREPPDDGTGDY